MKKGFSLFTPMVGVVIVVISMLLSIDMVNTETSVAAIITNRLEREKCVLEGDLVAVGQENIYKSQSVNIFEGTINQIRQNGIDIPVPDTAFDDFERNQYIGRVIYEYMEDTEVRVKAGLSDLFVLGAGLYSGSVGECFISAGRFTGIADAIRVDKGDPNNLVIIADSDALDKLDMELSVQDSGGNSIILPVKVYGGTYVSEYEIVKFVRMASDGIYELGSEVNKGLCTEKPGAACDNPCDPVLLLSSEPMTYNDFEDMVVNEVLLPKVYGGLSRISDDFNYTCSIELADRFSTPKGQMSANGLYTNFLIGVKKLTCDILDNGKSVFKITAGPFYYRHHDYLQNDREAFGEVQDELSCGVIVQESVSNDITPPVMEFKTSSVDAEEIGKPVIFTITERYGEEGLFGYIRITDSQDRIVGGLDLKDQGGGEYTGVLDTRDVLEDVYGFEITLQDEAGNYDTDETTIELFIAAPKELEISDTKLTWKAPFGRISEYYIYCSPDSGVEIEATTYCDYSQIEEIPLSSYAEPRYFRVVARELTGKIGEPSEEIKYTPPTTP